MEISGGPGAGGRALAMGAERTAGAGAERALAAGISAGVERLIGLVRSLSPADGLSLTAAATLANLERSGPQRLTALAVREGVTQPAMTQLVTRLERDGLARRRPDPDDARVVLVTITEAGLALLRERRAVRATHLQALIHTLPERDRRRIVAAVPALIRLADAAPGSANGNEQ
jgi:DNA-binding MarR family transcriptional regulator